MSATESAYANERVLAIDPFDAEKGLLEEAMVTIVLPYVKTAQEGVKRLGEIVENRALVEGVHVHRVAEMARLLAQKP